MNVILYIVVCLPLKIGVFLFQLFDLPITRQESERRIRHKSVDDGNQQEFAASVPHKEELRNSAIRYFTNNEQTSRYFIAYNVVYHTAIEILREEGWTITLETDPVGNLFYVFHGDPVKV
ncbi:hypothetical protein [Sphingobacterium spiritivorum]|uniref:hypothetical protein n=1 Tax=Sphingobacterium spiritivorum TaxID=258 RepID=UPI003DA4D1C1